MVYDTGITGFLDFVYRPVFERTGRHNSSETFLPQMKGEDTLLGPLEGANLNHWTTYVRVRASVRGTLPQAVYRQSVRLGDKPLDTHDQ
jgi:hypothetical protein